MVTRRQAREWALMMLSGLDLNPTGDVDGAMAEFWAQQADLEREKIDAGERVHVAFAARRGGGPESLAQMKAFAEDRVKGVLSRRDELDAEIERHLRNWSLYRLGTIERNAIRLGAWELRECPDVPAAIIINECVDLAKYFSETKSGRFVNGVLDHMARTFAERRAVPEDGPAEAFVPAEG